VNDLPQPHPAKYLEREMDHVTREFYRRLAEEGELATTRCENCSRTSFPPRQRCPQCREPEHWVELPRRGRLFAFTTQDAGLRFVAPAVIALAEIAEVLVPGVMETPYEDLRIGQAIDVSLRPEPETGLTLLAFELGLPQS
jgi:uncharacterized OB-fold protein